MTSRDIKIERTRLFVTVLNMAAASSFTGAVVLPIASILSGINPVGASASHALKGAVVGLLVALALHALAGRILVGLKD